VRALDLRDNETEGHTQRVTKTVMMLAMAMGIKEDGLANIRRGALLHDIGKIGVPDGILHKPGPLSDDEWDIMRQHPVHARNMLAPIPFLQSSIEIPYGHHERWNGAGYPQGLKEDKIPIAARIFAVVDVWDALVSDRPYRKAWPESKVLKYLQDNAGIQFDPEVVKQFISLYQQGKVKND
jgi:HD-GYP domain-containing protein (c-di-GMP phosphodiesterase class II)